MARAYSRERDYHIVRAKSLSESQIKLPVCFDVIYMEFLYLAQLSNFFRSNRNTAPFECFLGRTSLNSKKRLVIVGVLAALAGCANQSTGPAPAQAAATPSQLGACATNFSTEGGFWSGTRYSTFEEFPKKTVSGAFDALLRSVAASGYQINSSNKDAGMISASQTVSYGQGKTAPLNFVIQKSAQSGVRVDVSFTTSGGVSASTEAAQKEFCKLLATVGQSPNEISATPATSTVSKTADNTGAPKKKSKKAATE